MYSPTPCTLEGDWRKGTVREAAALNVPLVARAEPAHPGALPRRWSLVSASASNLVIETVKNAEDDARLVVRLYESSGQRGRATLRFGQPLLEGWECNLMEEDDRPVSFSGTELLLDYLPYEVRTFKVRLA